MQSSMPPSIASCKRTQSLDFKKRRKGKLHSENVRSRAVAEEFCSMLFRLCWCLTALLGRQGIENPSNENY